MRNKNKKWIGKEFLIILGIILMIPLVISANDPGHDSLYIEEQGDSEINGSLNISQNLTVKDGNLFMNDYLDFYADGGTVDNPSINTIAGTNTYLAIDSPGDVFINRYSNDGMVYLGHTGDTVNLNITGALYIQSSTATIGGTNICLENGTNCPASLGDANITGSGADNRVAFWTDGDTLSYDGNLTWNRSANRLGIGTTNPGSILHIIGSNPNLIIENAGGSDTGKISFYDSNPVEQGYIQWYGGTGDLTIGNNDDDINLLPDGNVGIGTTTPGTKLDVNGSTRLSDSLSSEALYDPIDDGLVLHMSFPEGTGSTTKDRSKYGHDGAIIGTSWVEGKLGNALNYSGTADAAASSDYVNIPDTTGSSLDITDAITMEAWFKTVMVAADDSYIITKDNGYQNNQSYSLALWDDQIYVMLNDTTNTIANTDYGDGNWHHITITWNGSLITYYMDGRSLGTDTFVETLFTNNRNVTIGARTSDKAYGFNGTIDEVRLYNRALSANEVRNRYERGVGTLAPYVDFDGDVGIGTTTPGGDLDIYAADPRIYLNESVSGATMRIYQGQAYGIIGTTTAHDLSIETAGEAKIYIDQISGGGTVGINTTSPNATLHVHGDINATGDICEETSGNCLSTVGSGDGNITGSGADNKVAIWTDGDTLSYDGNLTWNRSAKRLGIGTTNPTSPLTIKASGTSTTGGIRIIDDDSSNIESVLYADANGGALLLTRTSDGEGYVSLLASGDSYLRGGNVGIGTTTPTAKLEINGTGVLLNISNGTDSILFVDDDGKIGIGTTTPSSTLEIVTSETTGASGVFIDASSITEGVGLRIEVNGTTMTTGDPFRVSRDGTPVFYLSEWGDTYAAGGKFIVGDGGSASLPGYQFDDDAGVGMFSESTDTLSFATNGSEKVTIDKDGNVGIGTTSPLGKLHVNTTGSANALVVNDTSGNVGIGTASPPSGSGTSAGTILEVSGVATSEIATIRITGASNQDSRLQLYGDRDWVIQNDGDGSVSTTDSFTIYDLTAGGTRFTIDPTGNVGIGTASPNANLELNTSATTGTGMLINGSSVTSGKALRIEVDANAMEVSGRAFEISRDGSDVLSVDEYGEIWANRIYVDNGGEVADTAFSFTGNKGMGIYSSGTDNLSFATNGSHRMTITDSGNVGIGTTSPGAKLQIGNNTAHADNRIILGEYESASQGYLPVIQQKSVLSAGAGNDLALGATSADGGILFYTGGSTAAMELGANQNDIRMVINQNGSIGINTTNPEYLLTLGHGTIMHTETADHFLELFNNDSDTGWYWDDSDDSIEYQYNGDRRLFLDQYNFDIKRSGVLQFRVAADGDVGINTTSPNATLHVHGDINATGDICEETSGNCLSGATTYTAGNDIDFDGTDIDVESTLDFVDTINPVSGLLTINGNISMPTNFYIGNSAVATGANSLAIGTSAQATNQDAIAIGQGSEANNSNAIAIGENTRASDQSAIAIGVSANVTGDSGSIALGPNSDAIGNPSIAIGGYARGVGAYTIAIGQMANSTANGATALGYTADAQNTNTVAVGYNAQATGDSSTGIGSDVTSIGSYSVGMGHEANAAGSGSTAVGFRANATNTYSTAYGRDSDATAQDALAIGYQANATAQPSIAIGGTSDATQTHAIALGFGTWATSDYTTAIGGYAQANASRAIAIGYSSRAVYWATGVGYDVEATGTSSVGIGHTAKAPGSGAVAVGVSANATGTAAISIGDSSDATNNYAIAIGNNPNATGTGAISMGYLSDATQDYVVAIGYNAQATGSQTVALGGEAEATSGQATAIGNYANATEGYTIALGYSSDATGFNGAAALGSAAQSTGDGSLSVGFQANSTATGTVALGRDSDAIANYAIAVGYTSQAIAQNSIAIGNGADATAVGSIAIGVGAETSGTGTPIAIGDSTNASDDYAIAIGSGSEAHEDGSVGIGFNADSDHAYSMVFGRDVSSTATNQFIIGSATYPLNASISSGGRLGIGTDSPVTELDVNGTIMTSDNVYIGLGDSTGNNYLQLYDGDADAYFQLYHNGTDAIFQSPGGNFIFENAIATNILVIDTTSNNVGIGTADPQYPLHVQASSEHALYGNTTGSGYIGVVGQNDDSGGYGGYFTSTSGYGLVVASGNVGIGTVSPAYNLHIEDTGDNAAIVLNRTDGAIAFMNAASSAAQFGSVSEDIVRIIVNSSTRAKFDFDGNLNLTGTLKPSNECGIASAVFQYEKGTPGSNTAMSVGNGQSPQGLPAACNGTVTAISAMCGTADGSNYVAFEVRKGGVAQTCDTANVNTANTGYTTSGCSVSFTQNDIIGCYSKTATGAPGTCTCAVYVRFD